MNDSERRLAGSWKTDQRIPSAPPQDGDVVIDFREDGTATYSIYYEDRRDIVHLSYRVENDQLVTEQSGSRPVSTKLAFERDGSLLLWFIGIKGRFLRVA
jgi:hypothetical protein